MDVCKYVKGGVWWTNFTDQGRGSLKGRHMAVIISAVSNPNSTCTISVLPISSCTSAEANGKLHDFYCVPIYTKKDCYVCCNQIQTITTDMLKDYIGQCTDSKLRDIEKELQRYLLISLNDINIVPDQILKEVERAVPVVKEKQSETPQPTVENKTSVSKDTKMTDKTYVKGESTKKSATTSAKKKSDRKRRIKIYDATTETRYNTLTDAANAIGVHVTTISKRLQDKEEIVYKGHKLIKI